MKKHHGLLIHSTKDDYGPLEVIDIHQRMRSLHFGNGTSQSAMFLHNPIPLLHKYTQALLTPLCWLECKHILLLGMGAGSICKFILHHFPHIHLDTVELRREVINIARDYFSLPEENDRFTIHNMGAEDFISQSTKHDAYDLIIVDMFLTDHKKKDMTISPDSNYRKLAAMLKHDGYISINLIGDNVHAYPPLSELGTLFQHNLYTIDIEQRNTVLLAGKQTIRGTSEHFDFSSNEKKHQLPWRHYVDQIKPLKPSLSE